MQAAQLKTTLNAAAATLGEVFIPILEKVLVPLNDFARGLFDVAGLGLKLYLDLLVA